VFPSVSARGRKRIFYIFRISSNLLDPYVCLNGTHTGFPAHTPEHVDTPLHFDLLQNLTAKGAKGGAKGWKAPRVEQRGPVAGLAAQVPDSELLRGPVAGVVVVAGAQFRSGFSNSDAQAAQHPQLPRNRSPFAAGCCGLVGVRPCAACPRLGSSPYRLRG
jgi:hypothetical protein